MLRNLELMHFDSAVIDGMYAIISVKMVDSNAGGDIANPYLDYRPLLPACKSCTTYILAAHSYTPAIALST